MVQINGVPVDAAGISLQDYLIRENFRVERLAVECNGAIVPKDFYAQKILQDGDALEIVSFVGGG